jgi:phage baseplate assembly protein W
MKPNRIYSDLDLMFEPHPATGDVGVRADINSVKQSLKNLVHTNFYERLFHPEIGSPISRLLFEPMDHITNNTLQQSLERLIQNFEPRVRLQRLSVVPNDEQNRYDVTIEFYIVGIGTPVTFTTILKRTR